MRTNSDLHDRMRYALISTWQTIGQDIMDASGEDVIDRETVIEVVCDANHLETYGHDDEAVAAFRALSQQGREEILEMAFVDDLYC